MLCRTPGSVHTVHSLVVQTAVASGAWAACVQCVVTDSTCTGFAGSSQRRRARARCGLSSGLSGQYRKWGGSASHSTAKARGPLPSSSAGTKQSGPRGTGFRASRRRLSCAPGRPPWPLACRSLIFGHHVGVLIVFMWCHSAHPHGTLSSNFCQAMAVNDTQCHVRLPVLRPLSSAS